MSQVRNYFFWFFELSQSFDNVDNHRDVDLHDYVDHHYYYEYSDHDNRLQQGRRILIELYLNHEQREEQILVWVSQNFWE